MRAPLPAGLEPGAPWTNFAATFPAAPVALRGVAPPGADARWALDALREAERAGLRVRAHGAAWSFSRAAVTDGLSLDLRALDEVRLLDAGELADGRPADGLALVGPGATLSSVCAHVEARGRSLPATNGRGGLTLVGALATGSHGSAVDRPPIGDALAGVALAVASDRVLWVEGASPAVSDTFLAARGWTRVSDDAALAACQVHLGCMGVVLAAAIELEPAFDLEHHWQRAPLADLGPLLRAPSTATVPAPRGTGPLYHANLVINPHSAGPARLSTAWRAPPRSPASTAKPPRGAVPPLGGLLTPIPRACPALVGPILDALIGGAARPPRLRGRLGAIFPARVPRGYRPISQELALDADHAEEAVDAVLRVLRARADGFAHPGFIAVRWMRGSRATLGFTRFPRTVTIEIPTLHVPGVERTFDRVAEALAPLGAIEHPGQHERYDPARLRAAFGDRLDAWQAARRRLLGDAAWRFTSPWSEAIGLTG